MHEERQSRDPLCCCEYFDRNNERYHILNCCCNCVDFDEAFDRFICCKRIKEQNKIGMLLTFQDRLRIPWHGGAKQIQFDAILPVFIIPIVIGIAAINFYSALFMFIVTPTFLGYTYYHIRNVTPRTKFFFMWTIWSIVYLLILFESTVPLLELLPEENYLLILFACISIFCLFRTRQKSKENFIIQQNHNLEDDLPDIAEEDDDNVDDDANDKKQQQTSLLIDHENNDNYHHQHQNNRTLNICNNCRKYVPPRTYHCLVCQACIRRRDHHSYWLDCCIGETNHLYYICGLSFGFLALLLGSYLTFTSVCHPFLVFKVFGIAILLPDDCSEVFDQYEMGLSFIISIYSLLIAAFILTALVMQMYLISKGLTLSEWRQGIITGNRKSICWNWRNFLC